MAIVLSAQGLKVRLNVLVGVMCDLPHRARPLCREETAAEAALLNRKPSFPLKATVLHFYRFMLTVHHTKRRA